MNNLQQSQAQKKQAEPASKEQNISKDAKKGQTPKAGNSQQDPSSNQDVPRAKNKECC